MMKGKGAIILPASFDLNSQSFQKILARNRIVIVDNGLKNVYDFRVIYAIEGFPFH